MGAPRHVLAPAETCDHSEPSEQIDGEKAFPDAFFRELARMCPEIAVGRGCGRHDQPIQPRIQPARFLNLASAFLGCGGRDPGREPRLLSAWNAVVTGADHGLSEDLNAALRPTGPPLLLDGGAPRPALQQGEAELLEDLTGSWRRKIELLKVQELVRFRGCRPADYTTS
jgi:hypothetical protein